MSENKGNCQNCDQDFDQEFNFCPYCGQKDKDELTMGVLFYNTISNYFSFDARFLRSFFPLMFRPGYLAKKFVEGRRLQYLHPAQYYLFVSVIFFFLFSFQAREYNSKVDDLLKKGFDNDQIFAFDSISKVELDSIDKVDLSNQLKKNQKYTQMSDKGIEQLDSIINYNVKVNDGDNFNLGYDRKKLDSLIAIDAPEEEQLQAMGMDENAGFIKQRWYKQMLKFQKNSGGGILQAFFDSIPISLFILLPIFAMILKLFFWRRGSYSHHLVFSFYYFSFMFLVLSLILIANKYWEVPDWIDWSLIASTGIYLLIAVKNFYKQGFFISFIKTGFVSFIYIIMVIPIALTVMALASFLFY